MPEQIKLTKFIIIASVMVGIEPTPAANILTFGIVLLITEKVKVSYYPSLAVFGLRRYVVVAGILAFEM